MYYNSVIWEKDNILNSKYNWFRSITYRLNYFQLENLVSTEKLHPGAERATVIITKVIIRNFFPIFLPLSPTFSTCSSVPFYLTPLCPRGTAAGWMEDNKLETIRWPPFQHNTNMLSALKRDIAESPLYHEENYFITRSYVMHIHARERVDVSAATDWCENKERKETIWQTRGSFLSSSVALSGKALQILVTYIAV